MKIRAQTNTPDTTPALTHARALGRLELKIIEVDPTCLRPHPRNARAHPRKQIRELRKSFRTFGILNPILTDSNNVIIAGHARMHKQKHNHQPANDLISIFGCGDPQPHLPNESRT
jgi:hypothetical protein